MIRLQGKLGAALALVAVFGTALPPKTHSATRDSDEFLVVDCLLPGQVRKLGNKVTYVTQRRAVRTSSRDCEIRGGEYVSLDRADYRTSLKIWLPQAQAGNPEAQTYLGEMYEKGLGLTADYGAAAQWYRKAAEQGFGPAQINLGYLYEQGLGVPKDPRQALTWYRRASGLPDIALEADATAATDVARLQQELSVKEEEVQSLRSELEQVRNELDAVRKELRARQSQLKTKQNSIDAASKELAAQKSALASEAARLEKEKAKTAPAAANLTEAQKQQLASLQQQQEQLQSTLKERERALAAREAEIDRQRQEAAALQAEVARLKADAERRQQDLALREQQATSSGPVIEIIDPKLAATRGEQVALTRGNIDSRVVVGRINAPAGLLSLTLNDAELKLDEQNLFRTTVPVSAAGTKVNVTAVDKSGRKGVVEFVIRPEQAAAKVQSADSGAPDVLPVPSDVKFGRFHALVIGINAYKSLPPLATAVNDAKEIDRILRENYGFKTKLLLNATRYDILSALNSFREQLTEDDNLLIYYAGHGELDQVNQRGNWLPVDAERNSSANWISTISITDILNSMSARHVLVIADSCYSGALTRSALTRLEGGKSPEAWMNWLKTMVGKRSRTALTSGGLKPVLDAGAGKHSLFAKAVINVLTANKTVIEGQRLFSEIQTQVAYAADTFKFEQVPEYAPIKYAGHEAGDFFFVPRAVN